ncbi:hypothetical protein AVEN_127177-1 [Araneus ventricosus]|uniref:Uncharacterized protein n=1 Tax=Araneus ventricosus TaxID=182803 RepID=A0A4Y2TVU7_ARAVE|nr:hypothetical protein AVEN_273566-1 [Araneus ventricosus]GBO04402.1 hypothetical protein AVEN_127177-1 [Araneus ventricosus]
MVLLWVYRKFVESRLNVPPFCADKEKCNRSYCDPKFDETNSLELFEDSPRQWKKAPTFQKKRVFYFSPSYFSKDESITVDSIYKFYLKSLYENYSRYNTDSKYHYIAKTDEDERSVSSFQDGKCNIQETFPPEKYARNRTDLEKQLKNDVANQRCASLLIGQALDILHYYSIFPFYVTKMIFGSHNAGYYYVKYQDTSDLNLKSPDTDIYSVDDLTFENFCLQEVEENIKEPPSNLLLKGTECETDDMQNDGNCDQKYDFLTPEVYQPYYTLGGETMDSKITSDLYEANCVGSESHAYFMDQSYKHIQADEANYSDITAKEGKFKSSFQMEKYDFSLSKLFRKLVAINRMKPKDK